ncbi:MAG: hypothetical protein MJZ41_07900 [Bacteroidaceae bacterium]|nr:hypothetical protein [Bacteroidaceae bacterium]
MLKVYISVVYGRIVTSDELVAKFISAGVNFFSVNRKALSTNSVRIQGKCQPEQYKLIMYHQQSIPYKPYNQYLTPALCTQSVNAAMQLV